MPQSVLSTVVVALLLACVVALAIRSLWKQHKRGGCCGGDCCTCSGCSPVQKRTGQTNAAVPRDKEAP